MVQVQVAVLRIIFWTEIGVSQVANGSDKDQEQQRMIIIISSTRSSELYFIQKDIAETIYGSGK